MVGRTGFGPATFCTSSRCPNQARRPAHTFSTIFYRTLLYRRFVLRCALLHFPAPIKLLRHHFYVSCPKIISPFLIISVYTILPAKLSSSHTQPYFRPQLFYKHHIWRLCFPQIKRAMRSIIVPVNKLR